MLKSLFPSFFSDITIQGENVREMIVQTMRPLLSKYIYI